MRLRRPAEEPAPPGPGVCLPVCCAREGSGGQAAEPLLCGALPGGWTRQWGASARLPGLGAPSPSGEHSTRLCVPCPRLSCQLKRQRSPPGSEGLAKAACALGCSERPWPVGSEQVLNINWPKVVKTVWCSAGVAGVAATGSGAPSRAPPRPPEAHTAHTASPALAFVSLMRALEPPSLVLWWAGGGARTTRVTRVPPPLPLGSERQPSRERGSRRSSGPELLAPAVGGGCCARDHLPSAASCVRNRVSADKSRVGFGFRVGPAWDRRT